MNFINRTPHLVKVINADGTEREFPPSGEVARVSMITNCQRTVDGIVVCYQEPGPTTGLPAREEGVMCIVSTIVQTANPRRSDLVRPDTGSDCERDEKGNILAVRRFIGAL